MTEHTPGPWTYDFAAEPGHASEFMVLAERNAVLAYVGADEARSVIGATVEANARLIAVAPELLASLKEAHALLLHLGGPAIGMQTTGIRTVIAKAEGRES